MTTLARPACHVASSASRQSPEVGNNVTVKQTRKHRRMAGEPRSQFRWWMDQAIGSRSTPYILQDSNRSESTERATRIRNTRLAFPALAKNDRHCMVLILGDSTCGTDLSDFLPFHPDKLLCCVPARRDSYRKRFYFRAPHWQKDLKVIHWSHNRGWS